MSATDDLLESITKDATLGELKQVAHCLAELVLRRDDATLARFYQRMRQTLGVAHRETLYGFLYGQVQFLSGYFVSREPARRLELLAEEVKSNPLWLAIMRALDGQDTVDLKNLHARVAEASSGDVPSDTEVAIIATEDLANREIVERVGVDGDGVTLVALTRRGRALLFKITQHDPAAKKD